jgi:selenocysteine lyase/cysteine desulfurase
MPAVVLDAVREHLELEATIGGYEAAARQAQALENVYASVAGLIGAHHDEIALVENATRAWDMAFYAFSFKPGDRILTSRAEYASNYIAFLQISRKQGAVVEAVPDDEYGRLDVAALANMLDERVRLVAVTHVPTNGGLINPAAAIGRACRKAGVPFLLDACQSVGQLPIDVAEIGCDMLSATGRKYLRGPRGTGFLYVRRNWIEQLEPPFLDLHAANWVAPDRYEIRKDARRFENWEHHVAGRMGLGAAADYACTWGLGAIKARISLLADRLRTQLAAIPGVTIHDLGVERCGIVSFAVHTMKARETKNQLSERGINTSVTDRFSTLLDMDARGIEALVRASVHYYNTIEEVDHFCEVVADLSGKA